MPSLVVSLPMRDGNADLDFSWYPHEVVVSLPMRDGNLSSTGKSSRPEGGC